MEKLEGDKNDLKVCLMLTDFYSSLTPPPLKQLEDISSCVHGKVGEP